MTRSSLVARRVALPVTAALVGGTLAAIGVASPAHAGGSQAVNKSFDYECNVVAGGLPLGEHIIGVTAVAKVPATAFRGERIAPTPVALTLKMPELLRESTVTLLGGTAASGQSNDASIVLASGGRSTTIKIPSLSAAKTAIPQVANQPWLIPAKGTVPAFVVPNTMTRTGSLSLPKAFTITATVDVRNNQTVPANLTCASAGALDLATVRQVNAAPKAPRAVKVVTKKNKAKKFVIRAKDADGNRLVFKAGKVKKKAGKVIVRGKRLTFKPRKGFKGKTSVIVSIRDGKGGTARTKVNITVRK
ncbi:DUF6801 domain-containing protein [Aeromicrobium sp.]|uniref:DUF6801 domain-containing protein n=1 Tax=Aeromicrobium sp. TaxID=1871063 RepID=UPI0028A76BBD|nr:DUF6801 domain-containing protein [Aeromicrobium sp.]